MYSTPNRNEKQWKRITRDSRSADRKLRGGARSSVYSVTRGVVGGTKQFAAGNTRTWFGAQLATVVETRAVSVSALYCGSIIGQGLSRFMRRGAPIQRALTVAH